MCRHFVYPRAGCLTHVSKRAGDSHFLMSLMGVKYQFIKLGKFIKLRKFKLDDGSQMRLWKDNWLERHTLKAYYPNRYNIVWGNQTTVASPLNTVYSLNVSFIWALIGK
jgi:hypothetical protein